MKRQILVRGAAIAFAGVAASVFAAQQFMGVPPQTAQVTTPGARDQVTGASLMGGGTNSTTPQSTAELTFEVLSPSATGTNMADIPSAQGDQGTLALSQVAALDDRLAPASSPAISEDFQPPMTLAQAAPQSNDASCMSSLTAVAAIDALIDLRVQAPCTPNARIVVSHGDLAFSAYTDETGTFAAYIPALTPTANIEVYLPDQSILQAQAVVPDAGQHARVIVQWTGADGVLLHAYHRGAVYGQQGHIHASRPFDPDMDAAFVLSLGEARGPEPMLTQIYSVPTANVAEARLELELSVTTQTCGQDMTVYVAQKGTGLDGILEELVIAMPDCSSTGGMAIVPLALDRPMRAEIPATPLVPVAQN